MKLKNNLYGLPYREIVIALLGVILTLSILILPTPLVMAGLFVLVCVVLIVISPVTSLALLLILSPTRALINTEAPSLLPIDIGQMLFAVFIVAWGFQRVYRKTKIPYRHNLSMMGLLLAFIAVIMLTGFVANNLSAWLNEWIKWLIVALIVFYVLENRSQQKTFVWLLVISALGHAIVGIYTFLGGSGADHLRITERFFRAFGTFGQPNPFGGFMGLMAPLAIMLTYSQMILTLKKTSWMMFIKMMCYGIVAFMIIVALFASWSRGAWLGFVASMGIILIALPAKRWQSIALFFIGLLLIVGVAYANILPTSISSRVQSITQEMFSSIDVRGVYITSENYAVIERLAHWQAAINMAESNPILGVGMGNYDSAYDQYRTLNWEMSLSHAHNYYLNILAETGAVGLSVYLLLFAGLFTMAWKARIHPDQGSRYIVIGLLGSWVYLTTHSLTDNLYVNNIFIHIGVMIGLTLCLYDETTGTVKDR